ncbi:hypothetical protein B9479_000144 [Cryptococcus floricola]|uniref:BZIP domain-containing protein n=1 Tax=Cryptococcus floricola TaxID=2591691 RepID=A0A5D3B5X4_9TREE|nr:hypothetical protein B9479_000144 [Cryptococcus floricola]
MAFTSNTPPSTTDIQIPEYLNPNTLFQPREQNVTNTSLGHPKADRVTALAGAGQSDMASIFLNTSRDAFKANMMQIDATSQLPVWQEESWDELLGESVMRPYHNSREGGAIHGSSTMASRYIDPQFLDVPRSPPSTAASPTTEHLLPEPFDVRSVLEDLDRQNDLFSQEGFTTMDIDSSGPILPGTVVGGRENDRNEPHSQIDLASLFNRLDHAGPSLTLQDALKQSQLFVDFDDDVSNTSVHPENLALKRKAFEGSNYGVPNTKRRDMTFEVGNLLSLTAPLTMTPKALLANVPESPLLPIALKSDSSSPDESTASVADVKASTARPKSVVPEKFIGDGSAETALGMSTAAIQSFPTFEELLKHVHPDNYARAKAFGEKIAKNRLKAKNAAKRSRDQRRAKIEKAEELEKETEMLQGKLDGMRTLLSRLVANGTLSKDAVKGYI